ncbi:MAG: hypothetical protein ACR2G0_03040 [Chthoniobacterales bacterium]
MITKNNYPTRRVFRIAVFALLLSAPALSALRAQETIRTLERVYTIDPKGDAQIEFNFQLGARQWAMWKNQFGDHPDLMLRDVKYQLAAAVIDEFSLTKDDVHRSATTKMKARALASYLGNGQFQLQVPKEMKMVANTGTEWVFTSSEFEEGGLVNITDRAKLPSGAHDAHLTTGNDFNQLVYSLDVSPSKPKTFFYLGLLLLLAAIVIGALSFLGKSDSSPPPIPI